MDEPQRPRSPSLLFQRTQQLQSRPLRRSFAQRPSLNDEGRPVSQPLGEFQGRSARFSDSVVAQPEVIRMVLTSTRAKRAKRNSFFISVKNLVPFHDFI